MISIDYINYHSKVRTYLSTREFFSMIGDDISGESLQLTKIKAEQPFDDSGKTSII